MQTAEFSTLIELLRARASSNHAATRGYTFLTNAEATEAVSTWRDLDQRARSTAAEMQCRGLSRQRAIILCPTGLDFIAAFFGCLYAAAIPVPASLPRGRNSLPRLKAILDDAQPAVAIATERVYRQTARLFAAAHEKEPFDWVILDQIPEDAASGWQPPLDEPDMIALLQYTSGSTGSPRGVVLRHRQLLDNQRQIQKTFEQTDRSIIFGWLPLSHDMGLIGNVLQPLFVGAPCVFMSPIHFMQKPVRWLQGISRYNATTSGGPNFAYDLCVDAVSVDQAASLDLSSWTVALNGAEAVRYKTLDRFAAHFAPAGFRRTAFRPCYGLAEATLLVSAASTSTPRAFDRSALAAGRAVAIAASDPNARILIGCGTSPPGSHIAIVDPMTVTTCAPDVVGEVWVSGPGVGSAYWNQPQESHELFEASVAGSSERFLRTGDLGFLTEDGELFIAGRKKDLIIVRGRNIHPDDVEQTIAGCHAGFVQHGCAAFSIDTGNEEVLAVVQEVAGGLMADPFRAVLSIRGAIAETHEIQPRVVTLVRAGSLPRTSSGKIRRHLCRDRLVACALDVLWQWCADVEPGVAPADAPRTSVEEVVVGLWQQVLGREAIGIHDRFFDVGGDSLVGAQLIASLRAVFSVELSLDQLLENPTVADIAEAIRADGGSAPTIVPPAIGRGETGGRLPMSPAQEAIWAVEQLSPHTALYVVPLVTRLEGPLDPTALARSLESVVARHESLRTTCREVAGNPCQTISEDSTLPLAVVDVSSLTGEEDIVDRLIDEEARRPFDLATGPLVRATLFRVRTEVHVLLITLHHIISDHWSLRVLLRDLSLFYGCAVERRETALPPLTVQPADIADWEKKHPPQPPIPRTYTEYRGSTRAPLDLAADRARAAVPAFAGASDSTWLDAPLVRDLRSLARDAQATVAMALLASFGACLHRLSGERRFVVACPLSTREAVATENLIGLFVTTVAVPFDFSGNPTFFDLIHIVRDEIIAACRVLASRGDRARDAGDRRCVRLAADSQLMFSFLKQSANQCSFPGIRAAILPHRTRFALPDLCLSAMDIEGRIRCDLEYNLGLFEPESIQVIRSKYLILLADMVGQPHLPVLRSAFLLPAERQLRARVPLEFNL